LTHLNKNVSPLGNVTVELPETICEICVCGMKVLFYLTGGLFALYEFVDDGKLTQREVFSGNDVGYLSPHSEVPVFCLTYDGENHFSALSAYPEYRLISVEMASDGLKSKDVCEASQALCYQIPTSANGILMEAISGEWIHVKDIEEFGDEMVHFIDFERLYNTKIFDCQYNKQLLVKTIIA
uniref:MMS1_N domain-containing protein n=1 Tax=Anisakis simplex TaxID=6269 RepID=A0A0M3J607_ANISI